jgi:hypothetical protein
MNIELIKKKFWSKVNKFGEDDCWLWIGGKGSHGYGEFKVDGMAHCSHRLSYMIANNLEEIPKGKQINHHCDTRACVNPKHLCEGTQSDNIRDMIERKRDMYSNGYICSEETKKRMSNSQKGRKHSEETRKKLSLARLGNKNLLGHKHSEETKRKMSMAKKGERHNNAKLTEEQVRKIRRWYATGDYVMKDIADFCNIKQAAISKIITGRSWKHVI